MKFFSPPRIRKTGDIARANSFIGVAKKKIPALERFMSFQNLHQQRSIPYRPESGVRIWLSKVFGQTTINIHADSVAEAIVEAVKKIIMIVPIQVKRTNTFNPQTGYNTGVSFTKALDWGETDCAYILKSAPPIVTETFISDFSQVRYVLGNTTCSLIMYNYVVVPPMGASTFWTRFRVVNEKGSADFSYHFEIVDGWQGAASLSLDLQKLYICLGTPTQAGIQGVWCKEYTLQGGEWVETISKFVKSSDWDLRNVTVDRAGNFGGWLATSDTPIDIESGNNDTGWQASGDCSGYSLYSERRITDNSGSSVFETRGAVYNIYSDTFVSGLMNFSTTVAKSDYEQVTVPAEIYSTGTGHSFNYEWGELNNICCGTPPSEYPRESHDSWGAEYDWYDVGASHSTYYFSGLEDGKLTGATGHFHTMRSDGNLTQNSDTVCTVGGGYYEGLTTTYQRDGSLIVSANRSSIISRHDYSQIQRDNTLYAEWELGWSILNWYGPHPIAVWPPSGSTTRNSIDIEYPIKIEDVYDLANSFVSYDEESGVCFFGVRYMKYSYSDYEWHYYCRPSIDSDPIEINESLKETLGYTDQDFQTIECILFYNYEYEVTA